MIARIELVTGNLFLDETVEGLVVVEGLDDIVAIPLDVGPRFIGLVAVAVGVAGDIQLVASPAFAVCRRRKQAVDDLFVCRGSIVVDERLDLVGCRH